MIFLSEVSSFSVLLQRLECYNKWYFARFCEKISGFAQ